MSYQLKSDEVYNSYANAIIHFLVNNYRVNTKAAEEIVNKSNIKSDFINNPELYEFIEPSLIAKKLFRTYYLESFMGQSRLPMRVRVNKSKSNERIKMGVREIEQYKKLRKKLISSSPQIRN